MSAVATHVNSISVGMCQGFSAVLLPQLLDSNSSIVVNSAEASWIGECINFSTTYFIRGVLKLYRSIRRKPSTYYYCLITFIQVYYHKSVVNVKYLHRLNTVCFKVFHVTETMFDESKSRTRIKRYDRAEIIFVALVISFSENVLLKSLFTVNNPCR